MVHHSMTDFFRSGVHKKFFFIHKVCSIRSKKKASFIKYLSEKLFLNRLKVKPKTLLTKS